MTHEEKTVIFHTIFNIIQIDIFCAHINYKKVTPAKGMNVPKSQYIYKLHEPFFKNFCFRYLSFVYCCHIYKAFLTKK